MGWKSKKKVWFSPREIVAQQIGFNSFRYIPKKSNDDYLNEPATPRDEPVFRHRNERVYGKTVYLNSEEDEDVYSSRKRRNETYFHSYDWNKWGFYNLVSTSTTFNTKILIIPENYVLPSEDEIYHKCRTNNIDYKQIIKEMCIICYYKMINVSDVFSKEFLSHIDNNLVDKKIVARYNYYRSMLTEFIPGFTPLEQASFCFIQFRDKYLLKTLSDTTNLSNSSEIARFDRSVYQDFTLLNQLSLNNFSKRNEVEILNTISIISGFGTEFTVEKDCGKNKTHNSFYHIPRLMTNYEDVLKINHYERVLPTFKYKFATKDLMVKTPFNKTEKKQKLIILLDVSGSMNEIQKQIWVNALLKERLRYVIKGEAEVYFSYFVSQNHRLEFLHIKNEQDVNNFWKQHFNNPGDGATDIGGIVSYVASEIKQKRLHNLKVDLSNEKPEILIINDGQDKVQLDSFPYKVNAVSLMEFSEQLKDLCIKSGGKQIRVLRDNKLMHYNIANPEGINV